MCKPERKENKKQDAWNRRVYGKKLAKMYRKLSKIEMKVGLMCLNTDRTEPLDKALMEKYRKYSDKCWQILPDKYFWRGDAYYMRG